MKTVIEMAREAGFVEYELEDYTQSGYDIRYERFAELVRADEREACAKIADIAYWWSDDAPSFSIRARGTT